MSRYGFALRPRWLAVHVLVVVIAGTCAGLGVWQLRRYEERRSLNETLTARSRAAPVPLDEALGEPDPSYRRVGVSGRYDAANVITLAGRALQGRAGDHVLTPLRRSSGAGIIVDRGWVPLDAADAPTPAGDVELVGVLFPSQPATALGPRLPEAGRLRTVSRIDVERISEQLTYPVPALYLHLLEQQPPSGDLPRLVPIPEQPAGRNLSYAGQWFLFGLIALIGYAVVLRKAGARTPDGEPLAVGS